MSTITVREALLVVAGLAALSAVAGCSSDSGSNRDERAAEAVSACRGNGGVAAFDDDALICVDQTYREDRGRRAVAACRVHGGVSAFDDDIVICRDQTSHAVEEG